eukprot:6325157-Amphidinium_carterae.1
MPAILNLPSLHGPHSLIPASLVQRFTCLPKRRREHSSQPSQPNVGPLHAYCAFRSTHRQHCYLAATTGSYPTNQDDASLGVNHAFPSKGTRRVGASRPALSLAYAWHQPHIRRQTPSTKT